MNWDAIGSISEALGALAVFITLGYLAIQVRHAREEVRRSLTQSRGDTVRTLNLARATDARLAGLVVEAETLLGGRLRQPFVETLTQAGINAGDALSVFSEQIALFSDFQQGVQQIGDLEFSTIALSASRAVGSARVLTPEEVVAPFERLLGARRSRPGVSGCARPSPPESRRGLTALPQARRIEGHLGKRWRRLRVALQECAGFFQCLRRGRGNSKGLYASTTASSVVPLRSTHQPHTNRAVEVS